MTQSKQKTMTTKFDDHHANIYYDRLKTYQNDLALPVTIAKLNKFLCPLSTQHAVKRLQTYYQSRPNLKKYTLETELNRLNYTIETGENNNNKIIKDYSQIKCYANSVESVIWRCANQSILADVINALTGPNNLIRPQLLSRAISEKCSFYISFSDNEESMSCECILKIFFPIDELRQHVIAKSRISLYFVPVKEKFEAQVLDIIPIYISEEQFQSSAAYLSSGSYLGRCKNNFSLVSNIWARMCESESTFLEKSENESTTIKRSSALVK